MVATRGRPAKTNGAMRINDLTVDVMANTNKYGASICYVNVTPPNRASKGQRTHALADGDLKRRYWKTKEDTIVQVKASYANYKGYVSQGDSYNINVDVESYCIDNVEHQLNVMF